MATNAPKYPVSTFSRLTNEHLELVLEWRNKKRVRENMFNDELITLENHRKWFEKLDADPTRLLLLFFQDQRPIGVLNFSNLGTKSLVWGCYLGEEDIWPGSGLLLELAALDCAFDHLEAATLEAEVLEFNVAAQKLHLFFEYPQIGKKESQVVRDGVSVNALIYRCSAKQWSENRSNVLQKFPTQMREAASLIQFQLN